MLKKEKMFKNDSSQPNARDFEGGGKITGDDKFLTLLLFIVLERLVSLMFFHHKKIKWQNKNIS